MMSVVLQVKTIGPQAFLKGVYPLGGASASIQSRRVRL